MISEPYEYMKLGISSSLIVLPNVIGNRSVNMEFQVRVVANPLLIVGLPPIVRGALSSIACTLPGETGSHGTIGFSNFSSFPQTAITVFEKRAGDIGHTQIDERKDEQIVPEYMSLVPFAGPSPSGNAGVEVHGMWRGSLYCVKTIQVEQ